MPKSRAKKNELLKMLSLLIWLGMGVPAAALAASSSAPAFLKVLSLNFNSEEAFDDPDFAVRDKRAHGMEDWIKQNDPDVIFLQEAWSYRGEHSVAFTIARKAGYDLAYRLEMGFLKFFFEADAVLIKKGLHMVEAHEIKLPHSAWEIGDGKTWVFGLGAVSYAVEAKVTLPNGEPAYVYSTHLVGTTSSDRNDQAVALIADAKTRVAADGIAWDQANVIASGDFNSVSGEPSVQSMMQAGFVDTYDRVHPNDPSCSLCEDPTFDWFDPYTIAAGQFPSQAGETSVSRIDYVFSHGPALNPTFSQLTFTAPYNHVWMSDHYGVTTEFNGEVAANSPTHDSDGSLPAANVKVITSDMISWNYPDPATPWIANGPRGLVIENRSLYAISIQIQGPGPIYGTGSTQLNSNEQASFTFGTTGEYSYKIQDASPTAGDVPAEFSGKIEVESTGY